LKDCYNEYQQTPKGSKIDICQKIASLVAERGGRFLEKMSSSTSSSISSSSSSSSSVYYVELQGDRVIAKIAQGFRDLRVAKEGSGGGSKIRNGFSGNGSPGDRASPQRSLVSKKVATNMAASSAVAERSKGSVMVKAGNHKNNPNENNGKVSPEHGQAGRLSFAERVKLFQMEQEKMMRHQQRYRSDDGLSSEKEEEDDDDNESDEGKEENESKDDHDSEEDIRTSGDNDRDDSVSSRITKTHPSLGDNGDASETETEDSFPMYRGDNNQRTEKNDDLHQ
jgi:hypothetical protein